MHCFAEYGLRTDPSGRYGALYRPYHLIGMELGVSVASAVLRGEPTGTPRAFLGDVMSVAKRDLRAGEILDGEGGYMVYGKLAPVGASLAGRALPIGLAGGFPLRNDVTAGAVLSYDDVDIDETVTAVKLRRQLESAPSNQIP